MKKLSIIWGLTAAALAALVTLWLYLKKKGGNSAGKSGPATVPADDQIDLAIHDAETRLTAAKLGRGTRIGNLPVFLLVGEPGSAKTSVMLQSGLEAELLSGQVYQN